MREMHSLHTYMPETNVGASDLAQLGAASGEGEGAAECGEYFCFAEV
jgi:hypothetical protein